MIDIAIYGALGFLLGCLLGLVLAPPLWNRAVRLTTRKLEATMPMSLAEIQADKDQLRAEFAVEIRRVEVALEKAKDKAARELIAANKRRVEISVLKNELTGATARLQEKENANRVLEQTIRRRLPDLDNRLKTAKEVINELESANNDLRNTVASQSDALKNARAMVNSQREEIDRLRGSLEGGTLPLRGAGKSDARLLKESGRLNVELSRLKEELAHARSSTIENEALREEINKLAGQILAFARGERPQVDHRETDGALPPALTEQDFALANGNGNGAAPAEQPLDPQSHEAEQAADKPDDPDDGDEPTEETRPSLVQRFAARRNKRNNRPGPRVSGSLSDRLKDVAEAQDG